MIALLSFFVGTSLAAIIFRAFSLLGLGVMAYVGFDFLIDQFEDLLLDQVGNLDGTMIGVMGALQLDHALSMILSAYSLRFTLTASRKFLGLRQ